MDPLTPVVAGRYRLIEPLGVGATSQVFSAEDLVLGRRVALKRLRPCSDPSAAARLRDEARIASEMRHPSIAQVYDYGEDLVDGSPYPYVAMQLVEGRTLREVLREGPLEPERVATIVAEIADALAHAHSAGVVHRDVKPGNIVLTMSGRAVLLDFGIARRADIDPLTVTGTIIGTVDYLSPEQAAGQGATPLSDIYALGLVAYESLTGIRPIAGATIPEKLAARANREVDPLPGDLPPGLKALVECMVSRDPDERPAEAKAVALLARDPWVLAPTIVARTAAPSLRGTTRSRVAAAALVAALISASGLLLAGATERDSSRASAATAHRQLAPVLATEGPSVGASAAVEVPVAVAAPAVVGAVVATHTARHRAHPARRLHHRTHHASHHAPPPPAPTPTTVHGHSAHGHPQPHGRGKH